MEAIRNLSELERQMERARIRGTRLALLASFILAALMIAILAR